ncbi:hypothetical protein J7E45_14295 [Microbacterium sp. ISL-59]|uniref:hypothetical protein n=1 Tax=Microbacterium sp. ISL-59 TaxID=2819159 RepID=UPI001BE93E4B|nr:hypothetical protein [Microbacterium sp. ISL-59]MBT2496780.1 hypothetical protein [Microbacterium sp. ISL-59]
MPPPAASRRRTVARVAGAFFALATAIVVGELGVSVATSGEASLLIGPLDERSLLTGSMLIAFAALCVGLWSVDAPRWMLALKIIGIVLAAGAGALAAFLVMLSIEVKVTPLLQGDCDTGYVVVERSFLMGSSGTVYRQDGLVATSVARTSGNNAYQPFAMDGYAVADADGTLTVSYAVNEPNTNSNPAGTYAASFSVPVLADRTPHCGYEAQREPIRSPSPPVTSAPEPMTAAAVDDQMTELVTASLDASSGTAVDASGAPIDAAALPIRSVSCAESPGTRRELQLDFRTDDNTRSVADILKVWDRAGYEQDRAMQEDIRYSEGRPVERMSVRDTSSIDGLIHLTVSSICIVE